MPFTLVNFLVAINIAMLANKYKAISISLEYFLIKLVSTQKVPKIK